MFFPPSSKKVPYRKMGENMVLLVLKRKFESNLNEVPNDLSV